MNAAQLHTRSCRSDSVILEITLVVTLSSLIVFGALATIIKIDDDLIAVESTTQSATLPRPQEFHQSLSRVWPVNQNQPARSLTTCRITSWSF